MQKTVRLLVGEGTILRNSSLHDKNGFNIPFPPSATSKWSWSISDIYVINVTKTPCDDVIVKADFGPLNRQGRAEFTNTVTYTENGIVKTVTGKVIVEVVAPEKDKPTGVSVSYETPFKV